MSVLRKGLVVVVALSLVSSLSFAKDGKAEKNDDGAKNRGANGAARFAAMDGDGNGTVSLGEFTAAHEKRMAMRKEKMGDKWDAARAAKMPSAEAMFKKLDANADGELTAEEMKAGHKRHAEGEKKEGHKRAGKPDAAGKTCPMKANAAVEEGV